MANLSFKKGLLANLPSAISEGTFYVTTDERALYLDINGSERIRFGDFQEFATLEALKANTNPSQSALYYIASLNCLAKWNGSDYIQINLDTGATSFDVVGDGNAITAVSYDPATRKLTLTKGETFATPDDVSSAITEKVGEIEGTVKAYIDAKTEGIATDAALGELQNKVNQAEEDIDALEEKVGEKAVSVQIEEHIEALDLGNTYEAKGEASKVQEALDEYIESNDAAVEANSDAIAAEAETARAAEQANAAAAKAADDKAAAAQRDVDDLKAKVGEVPADKTVVQMIGEAQTAATYDDTKVKGDIASNKAAIELLNNGAEVEGSVDYKIAQAVAAIMENPDDTMNSINELVTWINGHAESALELSNQVTANKEDIAALDALVGETDVATQIAEAIAAALKVEGVDKYALAADLTAAIARIAALEGKAHEHENADVLAGITSEKVAAWDAAEGNAIARAEELNGAMDTRMQAVEGKAHEHANAEELAKVADGDVAKWNAAEQNAKDYADGLAGNYDAVGSAATAEQNAKDYADGLAGNYDAAGSAATAEQNAKDYADTLVLAWGSF